MMTMVFKETKRQNAYWEKRNTKKKQPYYGYWLKLRNFQHPYEIIWRKVEAKKNAVFFFLNCFFKIAMTLTSLLRVEIFSTLNDLFLRNQNKLNTFLISKKHKTELKIKIIASRHNKMTKVHLKVKDLNGQSLLYRNQA